MEKKVCCICGREFEGFGNNAQPLKNGTCCDACNVRVVMMRIKLLSNRK